MYSFVGAIIHDRSLQRMIERYSRDEMSVFGRIKIAEAWLK